MSRTISVSTEVFAAIWARRQSGQETEDAILRGVFGCDETAAPHSASALVAGGGVHDVRNDVHFPEGFEILRTYKRREYSARATAGVWLRSDNSQSYATLNQLNASIAAGAENVWNGNWKYRAPNGELRSIGELRRQS
ncbi:hypothetical protein [Phenylobacterium sp.]|uniref:hypothetical protein n=1 Tax=Phenylobacterium sp. TaxID=1871053 RepID=UPI00271809A7|nr:hypothetical protein [Phenylobacterium sp.]MDO8798954.1 hypothetical protein [Phenylobacterium sp.]